MVKINNSFTLQKICSFKQKVPGTSLNQMATPPHTKMYRRIAVRLCRYADRLLHFCWAAVGKVPHLVAVVTADVAGSFAALGTVSREMSWLAASETQGTRRARTANVIQQTTVEPRYN